MDVCVSQLWVDLTASSPHRPPLTHLLSFQTTAASAAAAKLSLI